MQLWGVSAVHRARLLSLSYFPAVSQVTDTGRLLHTLPGRSHLSHLVPQAPGSPTGSLVRSHPSFHSPVPSTLFRVKKKKKKWSYQKWKGEAFSSLCSASLQAATGALPQAGTALQDLTKTSETLDRVRHSGPP